MKKSILITGCSTGIGLDAAMTLNQRGYRVYATARQKKDAEQLNDRGLKSTVLDLTNEESIQDAVTWVLEETNGSLDFLFNNGAYGQPGAIEDLPTSALREQFETNLFGWHALTRLIIPIMRHQGHGRIIQNSSVLGLVAMPYRGAYNASKYALEGLTDTLRLELMDTNIQVILIEPGAIVSQFRANALAKFHEHIDWQGSLYNHDYLIEIARLEKKGQSNRFTLPASAVTEILIKALESKNPKARYYVTHPTRLFGFLKRILSTRMLDNLLVRG